MTRFKKKDYGNQATPAPEPGPPAEAPIQKDTPMDAHQQTIIGEDVEITGSIKTEGTIQIDGKLNGDLTCGGNAVIGATAVIKGNITSDATVINGQINGNVTAKDRIELKSSAKLTGDIRARRLSVEDGATLVGKSEVNPSGAPAGGRPPVLPDAKPAEGDGGRQ